MEDMGRVIAICRENAESAIKSALEEKIKVANERDSAEKIRVAKEKEEKVANSLFSAWNYYTIKDKDNVVGTIAIGKRKHSSSIVRGITICSVREKCDLNQGALQAIGRMNKAALERASFHPLRKTEAFKYFLRTRNAKKPTNRKLLSDYSVARFVKAFGCSFFCKAEFKASPTERELGILERAAKYGR